MTYYIYIARCADNTLYTGYTNDLKNREKVHNEGVGARYTRSRLPIRIIYSESFEAKSEAMSREHQLKQLTKKAKEMLVLK